MSVCVSASVCVCVCVCVRESVGSSETVNTAVLNKFVHYNVFMSSASHMISVSQRNFSTLKCIYHYYYYYYYISAYKLNRAF